MRTLLLRDPIHGDIPFDRPGDDALLSAIDAPEFQRLRRIRQLALASLIFHGAEHSRFTHSIGAFALMRTILDHLARTSTPPVAALIAAHRRVAELAALLHDLGHGPFSHAFEKVCTSQDHEETTRQLLRGATGIRDALVVHGIDPEAVIAFHDGHAPAPFFTQLLSSHLDVDRMDYLLRDAYMTGARAGNYDLERLVHALAVVDGPDGYTLAVQEKGQLAAEAFLLARSFMHQQVYHHKTVEIAEVLLVALLARAAQLAREGTLSELPAPLAPVLLENRIDLASVASLDDQLITAQIQRWTQHPDAVLADFADRFLTRRLLKGILLRTEPEPVLLDAVRAAVAESGFDPTQYVHLATWRFTPLPVTKVPTDPVRIATSTGLAPLEEGSELLGPLHGKSFTHRILIVPDEARDAVRRIVVAM